MHRGISKLLILIAFSGFSGCGGIHLGTGGVNTAEPTTPLLASGTFVGVGGATASGSAAIHSSTPGQYSLYIGALSITPESGLVVVVHADSSVVYQFALGATDVGRVYPFTLSTPPTSWQRVDIHSSPRNVDVAQAILF